MKTLEKFGTLAFTDEEYEIFIQILRSLPSELVTLSDLLGIRQEQAYYLVPEKVIELLKEREIEEKDVEWQRVMKRFNDFAKENLIGI